MKQKRKELGIVYMKKGVGNCTKKGIVRRK